MSKRDPDKRKLQMSDIARLAGVSTSTVSRALSGSPLINEATRTRILELAKSVRYSVNLSAQNLRKGDSRTIGVVIPYARETVQPLSDPFFLAMLASLADALTDRQFDLLLSRVDADRLDDMGALYETGRAGGIIVIGQWGHHDVLNELARRFIPIVVWGAQLPRQYYCSVGSDNVEGGRLATQHLIALGRRRIAFVGDVAMPEVAQRHEGYRRAHAEAGLEPDPALRVASPFTPAGAQAAMHRFLDGAPAFDALFAVSDLIAVNAMGVMSGRGIRVPQQVSVVGYDDVELAAHSFPTLTTVRQPIDAAGGQMLDLLLRVQQGEQPDSVTLPPSLIVRQSTCPIDGATVVADPAPVPARRRRVRADAQPVEPTDRLAI